MCLPNLKKFYPARINGCARLLVLVLCLLLAASSLQAADWLFFTRETNGSKQVTEQSTQAQAPEQELQQLEQPLLQQEPKLTDYNKNLEIPLNQPIQTLKTELTDLSSGLKTLKSELSKSRSQQDNFKKLEQIEDKVASMASDTIYKIEQSNSNLANANAKQADDLAFIKGSLKKEQSTKAFAKLNGVLGFEAGLPVYGAGASFGLRFGRGFLVEVGANYLFGSFTQPILNLSLDRLLFTASIGWEW